MAVTKWRYFINS